jgi:hypothetical protein
VGGTPDDPRTAREASIHSSLLSSFLALLGKVLVENDPKGIEAVFTWHANPKYFLFHPSHQIFEHMHGTLNVGKKITNCIACL